MGMQNGTNGNRHLQAILDALPHGVVECDCAGLMDFHNHAYEKICGRSSSEIIGTPIWDWIADPQQQDGLPAYIESLVRERPEPTPYFCTILQPDGTPVDIRVDWRYRMGAPESPTGFTTVITDVTHAFTCGGTVLKSLRNRHIAYLKAMYLQMSKDGDNEH